MCLRVSPWPVLNRGLTSRSVRSVCLRVFPWPVLNRGMPEGDTIYRAARTLHRALAGKTITAFESVYPQLTRVHEDTPITGRTV